MDSDAEWEEEEPGESISSSEVGQPLSSMSFRSMMSLQQGEDKEAEGDPEDSDSDDGFFVPHGYLSNDEGDCDDSDFIPAPGEDVRLSHVKGTTVQVTLFIRHRRPRGRSSLPRLGRRSLPGSVSPWHPS